MDLQQIYAALQSTLAKDAPERDAAEVLNPTTNPHGWTKWSIFTSQIHLDPPQGLSR